MFLSRLDGGAFNLEIIFGLQDCKEVHTASGAEEKSQCGLNQPVSIGMNPTQVSSPTDLKPARTGRRHTLIGRG